MTAQPTLTDGVVVLAPPVLGDAPVLMRQDADPDCQRWFDFPTRVPPPDEHRARAEAVVRRWWEEAEAGTRLPFVVCDATTGERMGTVEIRPRGDGTGGVSYATLPEFRGRGIATRALRLVCEWAARDLGLYLIECWVDEDNEPSHAVARKAGFVRDRVEEAQDAIRSYEPLLGHRRRFVVYVLDARSSITPA